MKNNIYIAIILMFLSVTAGARPARPGITTFTQPDGTTFQGSCRGDEFCRIKTTAEGYAIVQDSDGWWCYAGYDSDGGKYSTGHRVGTWVPTSVLNESRNIPYETLFRNAEAKRIVMSNGSEKARASLKAFSDDAASPKKRNGIVILAEYSDVRFRHTRQDFVDLLTKEGYSRNGATGSAMEYFNAQFNGMVEFSFEVSEIVTLTRRRAYFGANDESGSDIRPAEMVKEACELASEAGVDFALYDDDNDGAVDNVFVFFAGADEAENTDQEDLIWSHAWYVRSGAGIDLTLNGKVIDRYACTAEITGRTGNETLAGIGTFCHEYSHTFGLPDLYDTNYETDGWAAGTWTWTSLMDGGNMNNYSNTPPYYNAIEREILGISEPVTISRNGTYSLEPIGEGGSFYKLDSGDDGEYYLIENRGSNSWDAYIGGSGMLVYHIDKTEANQTKWTHLNTVNALSSHQCADLIEADGRSDSFTDDSDFVNKVQRINGVFFPYGNITSLTYDSTPGLNWWNGKKGKVVITDISRSGKQVTFNVSGFAGDTPPTATNISKESFLDAAIIRFESDTVYEGEASISWGRTGQEQETIKVLPYEPGKYSVTFEGLEPGNKTYSASIFFEKDGVKGESRNIAFMTSRKVPVEWPYIYLGKATANDDGTYAHGTEIALRAYNASEAEEIVWKFNGKEIRPEGDGYCTLTESGVLKACIYWSDGSQDILEKQINISE